MSAPSPNTLRLEDYQKPDGSGDKHGALFKVFRSAPQYSDGAVRGLESVSDWAEVLSQLLALTCDAFD